MYVTDISKVTFICDKCRSKRLKYTERQYDNVRRIRVECLDCGKVYEFKMPIMAWDLYEEFKDASNQM